MFKFYYFGISLTSPCLTLPLSLYVSFAILRFNCSRFLWIRWFTVFLYNDMIFSPRATIQAYSFHLFTFLWDLKPVDFAGESLLDPQQADLPKTVEFLGKYLKTRPVLWDYSAFCFSFPSNLSPERDSLRSLWNLTVLKQKVLKAFKTYRLQKTVEKNRIMKSTEGKEEHAWGLTNECWGERSSFIAKKYVAFLWKRDTKGVRRTHFQKDRKSYWCNQGLQTYSRDI